MSASAIVRRCRLRGCARAAAGAAAARPLALRRLHAACSTRTRSLPDEPADKLYNEGLFLLNEKKDYKDGRQEIRGSRPPAPVFGLGAQVADHVGLCLLRGAANTTKSISAARRYVDAASGQPGRGLCAVPDRLVLLRPDPRRHPRPGPHREGDRGARRGGRANIRTPNMRSAPSRRSSRARPARRQGDDDRPLLPRAARTTPARSTASRSW